MSARPRRTPPIASADADGPIASGDADGPIASGDADGAIASADAAPAGLVDRFVPGDLSVFTDGERSRFLADLAPGDLERAAVDDDAWRRVCGEVAWELLYRLEPDLYERLVAGERVHPGVLAWLPRRAARAIEVGAGGGRLTLEIATRCDRLIAVEPAEPLRARLVQRLAVRGLEHVDVVPGFFDAIPAPDSWADLVVSCSVLTTSDAHGGERGLDEAERVCAPGGMVGFVWPPRDARWLCDRGYSYTSFPGPMAIEFASHEEAVELARIFYPDAADEVARLGSATVPYDVIGAAPPRDVAWKRR